MVISDLKNFIANLVPAQPVCEPKIRKKLVKFYHLSFYHHHHLKIVYLCAILFDISVQKPIIIII